MITKQTRFRSKRVASRRQQPIPRRIPRLIQASGNAVTHRMPADAELKYHDVSTSGVFPTVPSAATVTLVNGIAEGTDIFERVGRKVNLKSLEYKFHILPNTVNPGTNLCRFMVVHDRQCNGLAPSVGDILESAAVLYSFKNATNERRFTVLADQEWGCAYDGTVGGVTEGSVCYKHGFIKLQGYQMSYRGSTGGIGSIDSGAIYFIVMGVNATYSYYYTTRTRFWD